MVFYFFLQNIKLRNNPRGWKEGNYTDENNKAKSVPFKTSEADII